MNLIWFQLTRWYDYNTITSIRGMITSMNNPLNPSKGVYFLPDDAL